MNARRVAVVVSVAVLVVLPSDALAHGERDHAVEDSVPLDHIANVARTSRTLRPAATARDAATAAAAVTGTEGDVGQRGPIIDWPVVGVHVALLPNGKVLAYDSVGDNATETYPVPELLARLRSGTRPPARRRR